MKTLWVVFFGQKSNGMAVIRWSMASVCTASGASKQLEISWVPRFTSENLKGLMDMHKGTTFSLTSTDVLMRSSCISRMRCCYVASIGHLASNGWRFLSDISKTEQATNVYSMRTWICVPSSDWAICQPSLAVFCSIQHQRDAVHSIKLYAPHWPS